MATYFVALVRTMARVPIEQPIPMPFDLKTVPEGFVWLPREQRTSRFGGAMPPAKPDPRRPALWLTHQGNDLFLVNASGERLEEVTVERGCFETLDDLSLSSAGAPITYRCVASGAAVKVDEYDDFYDLDWVITLTLEIRSRRLGRLTLDCPPQKGGHEELVLLWNTAEVGCGVSCTYG